MKIKNIDLNINQIPEQKKIKTLDSKRAPKNNNQTAKENTIKCSISSSIKTRIKMHIKCCQRWGDTDNFP